MIVGVPKEIKDHEYRVALTPNSVLEILRNHRPVEILVESNAGVGSGYSDTDYLTAGAKIVNSPNEVFAQADLVLKVKEPQQAERTMLRANSTLFTYLHLAPDVDQTDDLLRSGATCIAYETVTNSEGRLPLLQPMSEMAGRMSALAGAHFLEKTHGGSGVLMPGVPGVAPANVVIIGGGVVGSNAARVALGMGANVTILDTSVNTLNSIDLTYKGQITTLFSNRNNLEESLQNADLLIGAVLIPGASAPKLVSKTDLRYLKPGSVLVDVAVDQGGCFETTRPTTHTNPTFIEQGIVHYCVANMPGAYAKTATNALNNATMPYIKELISKGTQKALAEDEHLLNGLNIVDGYLTNEQVAKAQNKTFITPTEALKKIKSD